MVESQVRVQLRDWILRRAKAEDHSAAFTDTAPIIDDGLLTSLDVVELILFIENLRGDEVDVDLLEPESFANIDSLIDAFFQPRQAATG